MFGDHAEIKAGAHQARLQEDLANPADPRLDMPVLQLLTRPEARFDTHLLALKTPGEGSTSKQKI